MPSRAAELANLNLRRAEDSSSEPHLRRREELDAGGGIAKLDDFAFLTTRVRPLVQLGLKGCTVFRPNAVTGSILR